MIIYCITNNINSKRYIGKTKFSAEKRFQKHVYSANSGSDTYFHKAIRKYGKENFTILVLEESEAEEYWIAKLRPEYNMTKGGDGGDTSSSPKYKAAIAEYHSKKPKEEYATRGMLGKKGHSKPIYKNRRACVCEGKYYPSVSEAQKDYPGIKLRYRFNSNNWPGFYRIVLA